MQTANAQRNLYVIEERVSLHRHFFLALALENQKMALIWIILWLETQLDQFILHVQIVVKVFGLLADANVLMSKFKSFDAAKMWHT